jgi:hypothetical protein
MTDASIVARQFVKRCNLDVCSEKERVRLCKPVGGGSSARYCNLREPGRCALNKVILILLARDCATIKHLT